MKKAKVYVHLNVYSRPYEPSLVTSLVNISHYNRGVDFFVRTERHAITHLSYKDTINSFTDGKECKEATHLLFLDGTISTPHHFIEKLVKERKAAVSAMVPSSVYPYSPSAWRYNDDGDLEPIRVRRSHKTAVAVDAVSFDCILLRRDVVEAIGTDPFHCYRSAETTLSPEQAYCKAIRDINKFIWLTPRIQCERMRDTRYTLDDNVEHRRRVKERLEGKNVE